MADGPRMQQVIANLVQNALEATPAGGRVRVEVASDGVQARVQVVDSGVGLRPEEAERLFKPFPQLPGRRAGFGLGLFICRGIVEAHGGRITCHSGGPGRGATFTVEVPTHAGHVAPAGFEGLEEP
jgi:signal transduction histidine kinase